MANDGEIVLVGSDTRFRGPAGAIEFSQMWAEAFPDGRVKVERTVASDDYVSVEYTGRGTHTGTLRGPGGDIPATGRSLTLHLCDFYEIRNGKIVSASQLLRLGVDVDATRDHARAPGRGESISRLPRRPRQLSTLTSPTARSHSLHGLAPAPVRRSRLHDRRARAERRSRRSLREERAYRSRRPPAFRTRSRTSDRSCGAFITPPPRMIRSGDSVQITLTRPSAR